MANRKVISSFLGIPIIYWSALFVFFILQTGYDTFVGDKSVFRTTLLIGSIVGLILLIILSLVKRRTLIKILEAQMGAR